jgi:hypothetical protein
MAQFRYRERHGSSWHQYRTTGTVDRWASPNFGYEVTGQFQNMEEIENYTINIDGSGNRLLLPGDLIYKDANGDGIINAMDERPIGYGTGGTPIISFGMGTTISYGGLTLTTNFSGGGMYSHNRGAETKNLSQGDHNMPKYAVDRWYRVDPFNPQSEWHEGRYPPLRKGSSNPSYNRTDTFWRTNVRYVRIRTMELGYSVPNTLASNVGLSGVRVYTSVSNPKTWDTVDHYKIDPETTSGTGLLYPTTRLINVGFSARVGGN